MKAIDIINKIQNIVGVELSEEIKMAEIKLEKNCISCRIF